jgi:hypothetical protein
LVVHRKAVLAQKAVPTFGECQEFPRVSFRALEDSLPDEALSNEILYIAAGVFPVVGVGMLYKILGGDDAKLAEFDDGANFRFGKRVALVPIVKNDAAAPTTNLWASGFGCALRQGLEKAENCIRVPQIETTAPLMSVRVRRPPLELVELSR